LSFDANVNGKKPALLISISQSDGETWWYDLNEVINNTEWQHIEIVLKNINTYAKPHLINQIQFYVNPPQADPSAEVEFNFDNIKLTEEK
jgi:hypothetical protein